MTVRPTYCKLSSDKIHLKHPLSRQTTI